MYQFSRGIYRELAPDVMDVRLTSQEESPHQLVLQACESAVERLAFDRHYFARPSRTLFHDIRIYFPLCAQERVWTVVRRYMTAADDWLEQQPRQGFDINGNPLQCRATTRKGTACQRMPLPHNGYCPSHQHLAETEEVELETVDVDAALEALAA